MAGGKNITDIDTFAEQVAAACRRRESLEVRADAGGPAANVAAETLTELGTALEELRVAVEELRQPNQELTTARQDLVAEFQMYQEMLDSIPDGYVLTDPAGCIQKANRIAAALLGVSPEMLVGKPLVLFLAAEDTLFAIARDALSNVVKHAQARNVTVEFEALPDRVTLCIADDGVGFDPAQAPASRERRGWGLHIMAERALPVGGQCRIQARPGQGTRVTVEMPRETSPSPETILHR